MNSKDKSLHLIYLKLIVMGVFWGGTFIAGRAIAGSVPPYSAAFLRFATAAIALIFVVYYKHGKLPRLNRSQLLQASLLGLTGVFLYNIFFFKGLELINAGRASLIIANNPVFIALAAALIFREPLGSTRLTGIAMSVVGALVVITGGELSQLWQGGIGLGELFIFGCVATWVSASLIGKSMVGSLSPLLAVTYSSIIGAVALLPLALSEDLATIYKGFSIVDWGSVLFLGLFGTVLGLLWYYQGIEQIGAVRAGQFINLVPISAVTMGWLLLGETITASLLIGTVLVVTGVYITNSARETG